MSSGWFDCTEPSLGTALQGKQGVQGAYARVRGGSSTGQTTCFFLFLPTQRAAEETEAGLVRQKRRLDGQGKRLCCRVSVHTLCTKHLLSS